LIEFSIHEDPAHVLFIHVRGSGKPLPIVQSICQAKGWHIYDTTLGKFLDKESPTDEGWQSFSNHCRGCR
jgi:hypothetical protein